MTEKELARHHAEILIAWADGKEIQSADSPDGPWEAWARRPWVKFSSADFACAPFWRIKPQPREFWVVETPGFVGPVGCFVTAEAARELVQRVPYVTKVTKTMEVAE